MAVQRASEGDVRNDLVAEAITPGGRAALKLEQFLPYQLNVVASLTSQALSRVYARRYSIGVPEWRVLVTLGQYGVMTAKAIGAHTHMHKTKVSRAVALLEKRRLLARRTNREDMREAFLSLTAAGRTMYEELAPHALDFARRLTEILTPAERDVFNRALRQLTARSRATRRRGAGKTTTRTDAGENVKLYSYFRSSAAYRARIALNLKGLAYETASVHLIKDGGHNKRPEFRAVNPQMRVPALVTPTGEVLIQSLAIIEYLDETHPEPPLLPKDPIAPRARPARSRKSSPATSIR